MGPIDATPAGGGDKARNRCGVQVHLAEATPEGREMRSSGLIYDVGVNDGVDSAYYMERGFKVVGIEASPLAAGHLQHRFKKEIEDGNFVLLNVGIAEREGQFPFWVCVDHPEWSSFDRSFASRLGCRHHEVLVKTTEFEAIIAEYGIPHYCKIDIEGNDRICLEGLTPRTAPTYLSVEMGHSNGHESLRRLSELGYDGFKIISQSTWAQPNRTLSNMAFRLPRLGAKVVLRAEKRIRGVNRVDGWRFSAGSSGPFGEDTEGSWGNLEDTLSLWRFLRDIDRRSGANGLRDWYDIHATRRDGTSASD